MFSVFIPSLCFFLSCSTQVAKKQDNSKMLTKFAVLASFFLFLPFISIWNTPTKGPFHDHRNMCWHKIFAKSEFYWYVQCSVSGLHVALARAFIPTSWNTSTKAFIESVLSHIFFFIAGTTHSYSSGIFTFYKCGWIAQSVKHSPSEREAVGLKPSTAEKFYFVLYIYFFITISITWQRDGWTHFFCLFSVEMLTHWKVSGEITVLVWLHKVSSIFHYLHFRGRARVWGGGTVALQKFWPATPSSHLKAKKLSLYAVCQVQSLGLLGQKIADIHEQKLTKLVKMLSKLWFHSELLQELKRLTATWNFTFV